MKNWLLRKLGKIPKKTIGGGGGTTKNKKGVKL